MQTLLSVKLLVGLIAALDAAPGPAAAPPPAAPAAAAPAPVAAPAPDQVARFDELWRSRDKEASVTELKALASDFAKSDDYEKLWRVAHLYFWLADGVQNDDGAKKKLAQHGWDVGKKAVAKNPQGLAGLYWNSVDIGLYSEAVGVVNALFQGLESKFRDPLLQCEQLDPNHQNKDIDLIGPELTLGRYFYSLPWPKRSLTKSKKKLEEALAVRPADLRAHFYLAQTLEADGDKDGAKAQVALIASAPVDYDPPEGRRIKKRTAAWAADKLH
jgi:hypothetical protein